MRVSVVDVKKCYDPEGKAEDDSLLFVKYVIRPLSFYLSVLFIEFGFTANGVTWLSMLLGLVGSIFLALGDSFELVGCLLLLVWLILDHVDGNIARYNKTQSNYGDFLDTVACYLVLATFPLGLGIGSYFKEESVTVSFFVLLLGSIASLLNIFPRLLYQKMKAYNFDDGSYQSNISIGTGESLIRRVTYFLYKSTMNSINPSGFLFVILAFAVLLQYSVLFLFMYAFILFAVFMFSFYKIVFLMKNKSC
jgi:hypothetical protein